MRLMLTSRINTALVLAGAAAMQEPTASGDGAPSEAERGAGHQPCALPGWSPLRQPAPGQAMH